MACDILLQSSHLSAISILPTSSTHLIERSIRAAVEQHFLDLKTSIERDTGSYDDSLGVGSSESPAQSCHGDEEQQTDPEDSPCDLGGETPLTEIQQHVENAQEGEGIALKESSRMDLGTEALVDTENNINTARKDSKLCENMEHTDIISCDRDQNANTNETNLNHLSSCQSNNGHASPLQLFPDSQWDDFSCMHLQREGRDPVPAYKCWHDDSDVGEAQLSPLAGRMVPLPPLPLLEEEWEDGEREEPSRSHPHLPARRFLDFGAHGAQRFLQQDPDSTSPTKAPRIRRASLGSKEVMRGGDSVSHQLSRKVQHLKKKIKQFEEQFETERNYKPSHGDKAANPKVLKWMTDLTKIRKQIKDARLRADSELGPQTRPRSNTLPRSFGSTLEPRAHDAAGEAKEQRPSREETLELIQRRVHGKRQEDGWPDDIKKMTKEQLSCEKMVLQKNLLHYEGLHGRPVTREERLVVKPLYDRYRLVKQMLTRVTITPITVSPSSKRRSQTLQPIIEGETAHFCEEIQEEEEEEEEEEGESSGGEVPSSEVIMALDPVVTPADRPMRKQKCPVGGESQAEGLVGSQVEEGSGKLTLDVRLSSSNASSMPELLEQLWKARAEKKKLRKTIREFEEDFYQQNGRTVQKEDRALEEYREYKRIKAKLRLLEVLISKQDASKSI